MYVKDVLRRSPSWEEAKKGESISAQEMKEVKQTLGDVMKPLRYTAVTNNDGKPEAARRLQIR